MSECVAFNFRPDFLALPDADGNPLGTSAALMLSALAHCAETEADERGWFALSAKRAEAMTGFSHDTQKRLREKLMAAGYLRFRFKGQGGQVQYMVCTQNAYKGGSERTKVSTQNAYKEPVSEVVSTQNAYKEGTTPLLSPSLSLPQTPTLTLPPIIPPVSDKKLIRRGAGEEETEAFQAFYAAYPRKEARPKAAQAWKRIAPNAETVTQIMAGLSRAKRHWTLSGTEKEFIPHPATWLNQRRWEDEVSLSESPSVRGSPARAAPSAPISSAEKIQRSMDTFDRVVERNLFP